MRQKRSAKLILRNLVARCLLIGFLFVAYRTLNPSQQDHALTSTVTRTETEEDARLRIKRREKEQQVEDLMVASCKKSPWLDYCR